MHYYNLGMGTYCSLSVWTLVKHVAFTVVIWLWSQFCLHYKKQKINKMQIFYFHVIKFASQVCKLSFSANIA